MCTVNDGTTQNNIISPWGGSGVLVAVHNNIRSILILIENNNIKLSFVHIKMSNLTIIIGSLCIPNKSNENVYNIYLDNF